MSSPDSRDNWLRASLFVLIVLLAVGLIAFLKKSSDVPLTPEQLNAPRPAGSPMAVPDTTSDPVSEPPTEPDSVVPAEIDSITTDLRIPSDAGYEDGYFTGVEDGVSDCERCSYDESSHFPTAAQRRNYADAYRRGYAQGFADGQASPDESPSEGADLPDGANKSEKSDTKEVKPKKEQPEKRAPKP